MDTPTDETPTDETPTDETPGDETPGDETPTDETLGGETLGGETLGGEPLGGEPLGGDPGADRYWLPPAAAGPAGASTPGGTPGRGAGSPPTSWPYRSGHAGYAGGAATPGSPAEGGPSAGPSWSTWAPPPSLSGAQPTSAPHSPRRRKGWIAAAVIAFVVVVGGAGYAIGASLGNKPAPSTATNLPVDSAPIPVGGSGSINVARIAAAVEPATVDITSTLSQQGGQVAGTGMILTPSGEVLTNNHVVDGATAIAAQINGAGTTYRAKVLGVDPTQDVALLQLVGVSNLPTVHLGNSGNLALGDAVVAIGNALDLKGQPTVTDGIVSALNRSITAGDSSGTGATENLSGLIQTDAPINPGNSGGPLVDISGDVIGMNTAAATGSAAQAATNIGFAIPIDKALGIVQQIRSGQSSSTVEIGERGLIGVVVETVGEAEGSGAGALSGPLSTYTSPVSSGAVVWEVAPGSPAAGAGIQPGDVIVSFAGHTISSPGDLSSAIHKYQPNASESITWADSSAKQHTATIVLGVAPVD